jgi:hypothetical protein
VAIDRPIEFFKELTKSFDLPLQRAFIGPVIYADRHFESLDPLPGPIGFVKPAEPFEIERELRMLWIPGDDIAVKPQLILRRKLRSFFTRVA